MLLNRYCDTMCIFCFCFPLPWTFAPNINVKFSNYYKASLSLIFYFLSLTLKCKHRRRQWQFLYMTQRTMLSKHYQVSMAGLRILALCKNKCRASDFAAKDHRASLWNLKSYICNKPSDFVICICIKTSHLDKDPRTLARLPHASEKNLTNLLGFN